MAARKKTEPTETETKKPEQEEKSIVQAAPVMEVDLSEDDSGDDDEEEEAKKLSRREKKQDRLSLRQQAEEDRKARYEAEQRAAYATGAAQAMAQRMQQSQEPGKDPMDLEEEGLFREQRLLVQEYQGRRKAGELTQEEHTDFEKRGNQLQSKLNRVAARREIRETQRQQPQGGQDVMAALNARYPQVTGNPHAFAHALARYRTLITDPLEPAPDNWETADRVMQETMERFGMVKPSGNGRTEGNSRRYEGGSAGASGSAKGGESTGRVQLSKDDVAAADAAWPHLPEKERYQKYARISQANRKTA
jgi:hypothetical protein